jgi:hypothetical protein
MWLLSSHGASSRDMAIFLLSIESLFSLHLIPAGDSKRGRGYAD